MSLKDHTETFIMKIDLHVHTSEISMCGKLSVKEVVEQYAAQKYDAIVIANHFNTATEQGYINRGGSDFYKAYHDTVRLGVELGRQSGLLVLGAYELRFDNDPNDFLVFGMSEELCRDHKKIFAMTPAEFSTFARENDILFYQAHPFRNTMQIVRPELLFGIEVLNTHPRHDSRNDIALAWAEKYGLHKIAGSDCHQLPDVGTSAIFTDHPVRNNADLVHVLKNNLYTYGENKK